MGEIGKTHIFPKIFKWQAMADNHLVKEQRILKESPLTENKPTLVCKDLRYPLSFLICKGCEKSMSKTAHCTFPGSHSTEPSVILFKLA